MSRRRKSHIRFFTFAFLPLVMLVACGVVFALSSPEPASALSSGQWTTVKNAIDNFITGQYDKGTDGIADTADDPAQGEAGFVMDRAALKSRLDSNNNWDLSAANAPTQILGEGDDAANAPVLVDNLRDGAAPNGTTLIPGTAIRCNWNSQYGVSNCLDATKVSAIAAKVNAHQAAGYSTDIVVYCATARTESSAVGGLGPLAQTGALGGTTAPKVLSFKWGRNGWTGTTTTTSSTTGTTGAAGSTSVQATATNPTPCTSYSSDQDVVRCTAQWAIYNGAGDPAWGGNGYNALNGVTALATSNQVIDIREPSPATTITVTGAPATVQIPASTMFNTGLQYVDARTSSTKNVLVGRTHMLPLIEMVGLNMLGYNSTAYVWGVNSWNTSLAGESYTGETPAWALLTTTAGNDTTGIDTAQPVITGTATATPTATSVTIDGWTTNEASSVTVEYGTTTSYGSVAHNTVLHTNHGSGSGNGVTINGLSPYTHYYYRITDYDGQANASTTQLTGDFTTLDGTAPSVSNVLPSGNITTASTTISADYSDTQSGINPGSANLTLTGPGGPITLTGCTYGASQATCPVSGLAVGGYTIGGSVSDIDGNAATIGGSFAVVDNMNPDAPLFTSPAHGAYLNINNPTITGTFNDPAPSSGIATIDLSTDGGANYTVSCSVVGTSSGTFSCGTSGLADNDYWIQVRAIDGNGNSNISTGQIMTIDTAAPVFSNVQPSGWLTSQPGTVTVNAVETGSGINPSTFTVLIDGSLSPTTCNLSVSPASCDITNLQPLGQGHHTITVNASDNAGNPATQATGSFDIDTVGPSITNNQPTGISPNPDQTITASFSDATSGVNAASATVSLDGTQLTSGCSATTAGVSCAVTGLSSTTHNVTVNVSDVAGNPSSLGWSFTIDTSAPNVTTWSPTGSSSAANPTISFGYSAGGTVLGTSIKVDGSSCDTIGNWDQNSASCVMSGLSDGVHNVEARVWTSTEPVDPSKTWSFTRDTTAPVVTAPPVTVEATGPSTSVPFTVTADDAIDGPVSASCGVSSPATVAVGVTGFACWATDTAGNIGNGWLTITVTDTTAPTIDPHATIDQNVDPGTAAAAVYYTVTGSDLVDGAVTVNCTPTSGSSFPVGTTPVNCSAVDAHSNTANSSFNVVIHDNELPVVTPPADITQEQTAPAGNVVTFSATANDVVDGAITPSCSPPSGSTFPRADTLVTCSATDTAGNTGTGTFHVIVLDTAGPSVTGVTGDNSTITASWSDGGSGIDTATATVDVYGIAVTGCTPSSSGISCPTPSGLGVGTHTITVSVHDNAGNTGSGTGSISITDYPSAGAIGVKRGELNGDAGTATGPEYNVPGGVAQDFTNGCIIWNQTGGTYWLHGAIWEKYQALGGASGYLGLPKSDEYDISGGRGENFAGGRIYWSLGSSAHAINGGIMMKFLADGGPATDGFPLTDEIDVTGVAGARRTDFMNADIYWSAGTGVHTVRGGIMMRYDALGGAALLGLPVTDEYNTPGVTGGRESDFQRGRMYYHAGIGVHEVHGAILGNYLMFAGGPTGFLGLPIADEMDVPGVTGARMSVFQFGTVYYSPTTGAHSVHGGVFVTYMVYGGPGSSLGLPITDEYSIPGGARNRFEHGFVTLMFGYGAWVTPM